MSIAHHERKMCFISHAWRKIDDEGVPLYPGHDFAIRVASALKSRGITCFLDEHENLYGATLSAKFQQEIADSHTFLSILSSAYLESSWCGEEIDQALRLQKPLFLVSERKIDAGRLPPAAKPLYYAKMWDIPHLEPEMDKLAAAIKAAMPPVPSPSPPPPPPPPWRPFVFLFILAVLLAVLWFILPAHPAYPRAVVLIQTPVRKKDMTVIGLAARGEAYHYTGRDVRSPKGNNYHEVELGSGSLRLGYLWDQEVEIRRSKLSQIFTTSHGPAGKKNTDDPVTTSITFTGLTEASSQVPFNKDGSFYVTIRGDSTALPPGSVILLSTIASDKKERGQFAEPRIKPSSTGEWKGSVQVGDRLNKPHAGESFEIRAYLMNETIFEGLQHAGFLPDEKPLASATISISASFSP